MKMITTIFWAAVALLTSCEQSHIELNTPEEVREAIELSLGALTVEHMGAGTAEAAQQEDETIPLTKSSFDTEPSTVIKNLWVLQFSNQGAILGEPQYLDKFDERSDDEKKVQLIPTGEEGLSTIVYLANTFDETLIKYNYTIDDITALSHSITDEASNFITVKEEDKTESNYMIMYGSITQAITSSATLKKCTLKRTAAKITVTIANEVTDLTFLSAEINGIPNISSYYYPELTESNSHNSPAEGTFHTIDYPKEELDGKTSFTFYVPTNRRGVVNNGSQLSKNHFGSHNHTSINIIAQDGSNNTYGYTFFLGANLINDFNIDCDKEYKYNLTFKSKGDPEYDERVTLLNNIDYTKNTTPRSNCYILNPSNLTSQTIYIPIDRIDEFWSFKGGYTESEYSGNNTLSNVGSNWKAELIWHDSEKYTFDEETQSLGGLKVDKGKSPLTKKDCVVVTLPQHYEPCNVGFVVHRTDKDHEGDILWSWHLWITDYNPYPKNLKPSLNIWTYDVDGGTLHRYNNPTFMGGIYSDKFIMDRNIGARSADFKGHGSINADNNNNIYGGSLYYQFGRKDPFPSNATYVNDYTCSLTKGEEAIQQSFEYSVNNPQKYIYIDNNKNWCRNANSNSYIWNDHNIIAEDYTSGKSIFDPSPLGFRLPISDTWSDFTAGNESTETADPDKFTFIWTRYINPIVEKYNYGRLYTGYAYYPTSGYIPTNGVAIGYKGNGYSWSANPYSKDNGYSLGFGSSFLTAKGFGLRAKGYPVRPIQE